ncbi:conserved unknown protein [Ectocarpus siliculosus]|uniref:GPI transamidase component PIG-T n=1 Tax=Ectocarpus siliculosus TaxID=2880 RepID=D7FKM3_ECTSI|nr:conserved unknown protein [Ectocarpus siliculosus]|eukprot:CBJ29423.1 conserved unknown protein [Ectocarpus siliculosus]
MSKGRWDTVGWGNGPGDGSSGEYTPGGAEMWARLPDNGAWESWVGLRRSLSGLYCSSLDGMDETRVHTPLKMAMPGEVSYATNGTTVLRGTLPREPICTENLIPLIKMLPCRSKTGLGSLLHPTRLFQSDYHSISVRASATFSDRADNHNHAGSPGDTAGAADTGGGGVITSLTLEQTVLAVFRPRPNLPSAASTVPSRGLGSTSTSTSSSVADRAGKGGDGTEAKAISEGEGWSISSLLLPPKLASSQAVQLEGCPVASRSAIHVFGGLVSDSDDSSPATAGCAVSDSDCDAGPSGAAADPGGDAETPVNVISRVLPSPVAAGGKKSKSRSSTMTEFLQRKLWDLATGSDGQASVEPSTITEDGAARADAAAGAARSYSAPPVAGLDHYLSGRGGTRGVSVSHLVNMHPTSGALAEFVQPVPFFMVPMLGTLRARLVSPCSSSRLGDSGAAHHPGTSTEGEVSAATLGGGASAIGGERCIGGDDGGLGPLVNPAQNITLTPGEGRRPAVVEVRAWVPPASTLVLEFDFFKRFLTVEEFPPDPSRGLDVPPPLARFSFAGREGEVGEPGCQEGESGGQHLGHDGSCAAVRDGGRPLHERRRRRGEGRVVYAYGEAGLLDSPQPDFSMPFNVITFTSTVITFFLGTAINLLVRKSASSRRKKKSGNADNDGDNDSNGKCGNSARGNEDNGRRWFHGLLGVAFGFLKRGRGQGVAAGRIRKEVGRVKGD